MLWRRPCAARTDRNAVPVGGHRRAPIDLRNRRRPRVGDHISFSPFRLACPFLPTMMWSCTATPSGRTMSTIPGHPDIGLRRGGIAAVVVVHEAIAPRIVLNM